MLRPSVHRWPPLARARRWIAVGLVAVAATSCGTCPRESNSSENARVERTLEALYRSFGFEAGADPDWIAMRGLFADGAVFVDPIAPGAVPRAVDAEEFVRGFRDAIHRSPTLRAGFLERIVNTRVDLFGGIAHAYVVFEGFVPASGEVLTRGLDSIQLVLAGDEWKLVSFTTQYETNALALPRRFLAGR